jgi:cobalt transporter subunit CbtB
MVKQDKTIHLNQQTLHHQRVLSATVGFLLGIFLLLGIGFTGSNMIHNAAHDTRHANTFPCH